MYKNIQYIHGICNSIRIFICSHHGDRQIPCSGHDAKVVPHKQFSFAKIWKIYAEFEAGSHIEAPSLVIQSSSLATLLTKGVISPSGAGRGGPGVYEMGGPDPNLYWGGAAPPDSPSLPWGAAAPQTPRVPPIPTP